MERLPLEKLDIIISKYRSEYGLGQQILDTLFVGNTDNFSKQNAVISLKNLDSLEQEIVDIYSDYYVSYLSINNKAPEWIKSKNLTNAKNEHNPLGKGLSVIANFRIKYCLSFPYEDRKLNLENRVNIQLYKEGNKYSFKLLEGLNLSTLKESFSDFFTTTSPTKFISENNLSSLSHCHKIDMEPIEFIKSSFSKIVDHINLLFDSDTYFYCHQSEDLKFYLKNEPLLRNELLLYFTSLKDFYINLFTNGVIENGYIHNPYATSIEEIVLLVNRESLKRILDKDLKINLNSSEIAFKA